MNRMIIQKKREQRCSSEKDYSHKTIISLATLIDCGSLFENFDSNESQAIDTIWVLFSQSYPL
mgnify:FL=1